MSVWESTISLIIIIINVFSAINYIVYKGNKRGGGGGEKLQDKSFPLQKN